MPKRGAEVQITKDDRDDGDEQEVVSVGGTWKQASAEKLAERKIVKVKRKGAAEGAAAPAFSFGTGAEEKKEAAGFNFNFGGEKKEESNGDAKPAEAAPTPAVNAFAALVNKNDWECTACMVPNKEADKKCRACETPRPGHEDKKDDAPAPAAAGFTFGFNAGTAASGAAPFTFGATASTGGVTFGSSSGVTFGTNAGAVTFGTVSNSDSTFGKGAGFSFEPASTFSAPAGDQTKEEFKDKKAVATGTENDTTIFKINCKVYKLEAKEGEKEGAEKKAGFVEKGEGELHVNTLDKDGSKLARCVLRADKTQRLVLNAPLFKGMTFTVQNEKFVKFASSEFDAEGKSTPAVYLLRFKTNTESASAVHHFEKAISTLEE